MTEVFTDERAAAALRPFVRSTASVLQVMRESDPLRLRRRFHGDVARGSPEDDSEVTRSEPADRRTRIARFVIARFAITRKKPPPGTSELRASDEADDPGLLDKLMNQLDGMRLPGSTTWDAMTVEQRCDWWTKRIGRFLALIAGLPNLGGVITSRLPIRNALGITGQGLVLGAIAAEHGIHDQTEQVRLLAKVLLERDLPRRVASGESGGSQEQDDARTAELSGDLDSSRRRHGRPTTKAVMRTVWRMARALWEIDSELDKRPQGRFYHEMVGAVPVVGVVGGYLGERSALRRVAKRGTKWIRKQHPSHG